MNKYIITALLFAQVTGLQAAHDFLSTDDHEHRLAVFEQGKGCIWEYKVEKPYSATLRKDGTILLTSHYAVECIDVNKRKLWEYKPGGEVFGVEVLPDGRIAVAECTNTRISVLDSAGEKLNSFDMKVIKRRPAKKSKGKKGKGAKGAKGAKDVQASCHSNSRSITATVDNTVLVGHLIDHAVREYALDGKLVNEFKVVGMAYMGQRLANGNTLVAAEKELVEFAPDHSVVWRVTDADIPEVPFSFITCIRRLENGNTVIGNWLGHGFKGKKVSLFEISPDKKVVWKFDSVAELPQPTSFSPLSDEQLALFKK